MEQHLRPHAYDHDLRFYQDAENIPNQTLVGEIITYFTKGEGSRVFDTITILNLSYKQVQNLALDIERTEDLLGHLDNLPLTDLQRHVLLGTMLKWLGGYPVNNLDENYQKVMLGIEQRFLDYPGDTPEKEFARRDEQFARKLRKLSIALTSGIRYGLPAEKILTEMEDEEDLTEEKEFSSFESLFREAAIHGVFGELPNKTSFALRLSEVNYSFNEWLRSVKGWNTVDKAFYQRHLTQPVFMEYLSYRQEQQLRMDQVAQRRRESWYPKSLKAQPISKEAVTESNSTPDTTETPNNLVFVTYCWEDENHQEKVRGLTQTLKDCGENATMDRQEMQKETAINLKTMMLRNFRFANKVVVVLSKGYKERADNEKGGVFFEYKIILEEIDKFPKKYVLVSFENFDPELLPLGLAGRQIYTLKEDKDVEPLLHKLRDVDEFEFGPVAASKPELKSKPVQPLFAAPGSTAKNTPQQSMPVLTIAEERLPESAVPSDEHWVIRCFDAPAINIYARLWVDEKNHKGSTWATIPSLEPQHNKELIWIRHCDVIEIVWSDTTVTNFYRLRIQHRKPVTSSISKEEYQDVVDNVGRNNDYLNRAMIEFLLNFNLEISKLDATRYEYFLRAHNMLLPL